MTEKEEGKLKQLKAGMRQKETECKRCPYHVFRSKEHCENCSVRDTIHNLSIQIMEIQGGHSKVQLEGITAIMAVCGIIAIEAAVFTGLSICAGCILSQRNNNDGKKKRKNKKRRKTQ